MRLQDKIIGVLMGGWSPEREISLKSGNKVAESLRRQGFKVIEIDIMGSEQVFAKQALELLNEIDIAFIALHGSPGEDGTVQGMLELLGIPYTGSGVLASSICMNKLMTKKVLIAEGIKVPKYVEVQGSKFKVQGSKVKENLGELPWIVKPVSGGSSIGVEIVKEESKIEEVFNKIKAEHRDAFIEEFISGIEVTVGILGEEALPVAELIPKTEFFDYYAKYTSGVTEDIIPARLPESVYKKVQFLGLQSHRAVGCSGFSRVDMKINNENVYVLDINSIPGLTDMSVFPAEAAYIGMSYDELIYKILELAILSF